VARACPAHPRREEGVARTLCETWSRVRSEVVNQTSPTDAGATIRGLRNWRRIEMPNVIAPCRRESGRAHVLLLVLPKPLLDLGAVRICPNFTCLI